MLSVDAVGAFDHVARQSMLNALLERPDLRPLLPYARQFYAAPSIYTWYDGLGAAHDIVPGEGKRRTRRSPDARPVLFSHPASIARNRRAPAGWGGNFCFPRRRLCRRVASARQALARCAFACFVGACPCAAQRRLDPCLERGW